LEIVRLAARGRDGPERVVSSTAAGAPEGGIRGVRARKRKVRETVLNMVKRVSGVWDVVNARATTM
jgi:hypothetical protein